MKRRLIFGFVIALLTVNLLIGAGVYSKSTEAAQKDAVYPNLRLFSEVLEKVRKDYVDGTNLSYQELVQSALKGMINTLDPHSEFLDAEKYKELQSDTEGRFGGLGIVITLKDNYVTVLAPMDGTPGYRAGIQPGDRIIKIDGNSAEKLDLTEAVKYLRGEPGTDVTITVFRPATGETKEYTLTREIINVDMVVDINGKKEFPLGADKIGYVRLVQFGDKTSDDLEVALRKLKSQGMRALVLDLRWNPGGLLDQAVDVCQKFLPRGQLVVSTEGRDVSQKKTYYASGRGDELHNMPMVLLVNSLSASASEIVSGCLQDLHRAYVLGEKTFGKGSVQSIIPLDDGAALRLTTAKYYTPSHKTIHEVGITPNMLVPVSDDQERDARLMRTPGGIEILDEKDRERLKNTTDVQFDRAMDLLKGILLYTDRTTEKSAAKEGRMAAN
jgi:carboxyl-terminal processing protease